MTAPRPIVFTDLDGTLFQTARKMPGDATNAHLAAEAKNGQHSYMTPAQEALVAWLNATTRLVPVTARSTEALARCTIVFRDWRVAANGAIILDPAGAPDPDWGTHIAQISRDWAPTLAGLEAKVAAGNGDGKLRHWIVREDGLPIYYCVKSNGDERWLDDVADELRSVAGLGLDVHRNGNNLSYTPEDISKRAAVEYLLDQWAPAPFVLGLGDSLTDLPFMELCDLMAAPPGSQIAHAMVPA